VSAWSRRISANGFCIRLSKLDPFAGDVVPDDSLDIAVGLEEGAKEIQNLRAERQRQQKQQKTEAIKSSTLLGEEQRKAVEKAADSLLAFLNGITANKPPAALT
jgi:6-phosphofructokinase